TLFDAGPDFYGVGRLGGELAAEILSGADMSKIPVRDLLETLPPYLLLPPPRPRPTNPPPWRGWGEPWQAPPPLLADATAVVDDTGVHRKNAPVAADARATNRKWKGSFIELVHGVDLEED